MQTTFTKLSDELIVGDRPFMILGANLGNRMTAVKLSNGDVVVISPNRFDDSIAKTLKAFGRVRYFIAPNLHHNLFFERYKEVFPDAVFYASPTLHKTSKKFVFDKALDEHNMPWESDLDSHHVQGAPGIDEFVFFHHASRTLILTDLAMNFTCARNAWEAAWYKLVGAYKRFHVTLFVQMLIKDKQAFRQSLKTILEWPFENIIVTHGEMIRDNQRARDIFKNGYPYLK